MEQSKALKILKENRQALADKYGVKKLGVFPREETTKFDYGCGYHPQIGVAVEYEPGVRPGLDFFGLQEHIEELLKCEISLARIGGHRRPHYERTDDFMKDVVYVG